MGDHCLGVESFQAEWTSILELQISEVTVKAPRPLSRGVAGHVHEKSEGISLAVLHLMALYVPL
jgi:hypothetical protein